MVSEPLMRGLVVASACIIASSNAGAQQGTRLLTIGDMQRLHEVSDPRLSPSGDWITYTISGTDSAHDRANGDIWLARWDGTRAIRITYGTEDEHSPQFAGSEHAISFLSARGDSHDSDQLWLLSTDGGEAHKLTAVKDGVDDYSWSPEGKRVVLALRDSTADADSAPHPIVLDRYQFKQDIEGYLEGRDRRRGDRQRARRIRNRPIRARVHRRVGRAVEAP